MQGRYVTMRVLLNAGVVSVKYNEDKTDYTCIIDRKAIFTKGKEALAKFLLELQVYKTTGDIEKGLKFYNDYSKVDEEFLKLREITLLHKKPRRLEL